MSKNGSNKEYLFSLYSAKLNSRRLEETLKLNFDAIALEKWHEGRRVDISGVDKNGTNVLIDWCLKDFDKEHYMQIKSLISIVSKEYKSLIVAGATSFKNASYVMGLIQEVISENKNIELIFLEINSEVIPILQEVNNMDCLEQIENLSKLNSINNHFKVVRAIKNYNNDETISAKVIEYKNYDYKQRLLYDILERLREDSPHINLYTYKKIIGNSFFIGGGMAEITYKVTWDRRNRLVCEATFTNKKGKEVYYKLLEKKADIDNYMDYMITWNDNPLKIFTYINPLSYIDKNRMVKYFSRIVRKYIYGLHKFIIEEIKNIQNDI
ncbi:hypothetical protein ACJDT4_09380 [Clostridium neuense]|uniref:DUF4268 domain-containing protein n=1 Tax=Clostridium neuense TaxID=1728934 RepID=A0ABW8TDY7_9CLOT